MQAASSNCIHPKHARMLYIGIGDTARSDRRLRSTRSAQLAACAVQLE